MDCLHSSARVTRGATSDDELLISTHTRCRLIGTSTEWSKKGKFKKVECTVYIQRSRVAFSFSLLSFSFRVTLLMTLVCLDWFYIGVAAVALFFLFIEFFLYLYLFLSLFVCVWFGSHRSLLFKAILASDVNTTARPLHHFLHLPHVLSCCCCFASSPCLSSIVLF